MIKDDDSFRTLDEEVFKDLCKLTDLLISYVAGFFNLFKRN